MQRHLVYGRAVITGVIDRHRAEVIEDGAVYAEDGRIVAVGTPADLRARYPEAAETGSSSWVLLPGLVNAHHHVGLTPLQLGSRDHPLELWFASRLGARRPDLYLDTLHSAFEMIESGVTTVQHLHGWVPGGLVRISEAAETVIRAYGDVGMRVSYSFAVRDQNRLVYGDDEVFAASLPPELQPMMRRHFDRIWVPLEDHFTLYAEAARPLPHCLQRAAAVLEEVDQRHALGIEQLEGKAHPLGRILDRQPAPQRGPAW
jgi:5-methylthioadenosine/S-adenosylhomocysteine deaminase